MASTSVEIGPRRLKLSNLDKVLYPDAGFTKAEVIDYYVRIAPVLIDHLGDRGITMRRFPNGAVTHSIVMRSKSGTVRYVEGHHNFAVKRPVYAP